MLDRKTEAMLQIANSLTAEDLDEIRAGALANSATVEVDADPVATTTPDPQATDSPRDDDDDEAAGVELTRGERERSRTRESKVSTGCLGQPREAHTWWPIGTELTGQFGTESFSAVVIENPRIKSGCSIRITSGAANGQVCLTPTRAAIEATEDYRQTNGLGRGGGITNGWTFWKTRT
jgi:hypothetical protein